ncbi:MAG: hypothetical protein GX591_14945 [Planctomycetes bacterium]|nr:hypothetical protein [Planctomycetota bacterium]
MSFDEPIDVRRDMKVKVTPLAGVRRVDVNQLGAAVPEPLRDRQAPAEDRKAWAARHDEALLDALDDDAAAHGGDFNSFAEWTTMCGVLYDFKDINARRRDRFSAAYRAAISTVFGLAPEAGLGALIQATAYVPDPGVRFAMAAWQPEALYDTASMALAPAVTVRFGGAAQVYLSGVMDWDADRRQLHGDDPRAQIRSVLERIIRCFEQAGGSAQDVVRLRPVVPTADCLAILAEEVAGLWRGALPPVVLPIAGLPMPAGQYAEIQAYGIVGDGGAAVEHRALGDAARAAAARDFELIQAGPFAGSAADAAGRLRRLLAERDIPAAQVANVMLFARSDEHARAFTTALAPRVDPASVHAVRARAENPLGGGDVLAEAAIVAR